MSGWRFQFADRSSDGFIVVAVLWILSALATLASIYSIYVANAAVSVSVNDDAVRAEALVSASLELAAHRVTVGGRANRPSRGHLAFRMNGANVTVEFCSEAARIDLNKASKELLAGLFGALGSPGDAEQYADRVIGWRSAARSGSQDNEESLYRAAGFGYGPRRAPFAHVGELALVLGFPPVLVERASPFVTVYSGRAKINVRDAAPEIIAALPGMTPERLGDALSDRQSLLGDPGLLEVTNDSSKAVRVNVRMVFDSGRAIAAESVILVDGDTEPYRILSWTIDTDVQSAFLAARNTGRAP